MNGFHVHAIGWVLTANACALTAIEARELADLWTALVRSRAEDLHQTPILLQFLFPRSVPLTPESRAALASLVARMAAQHPERFSSEALRQRRNHWAGQTAFGLLLSGLTAVLVPADWAWAAPVVPTFFLMGCGCLVPTLTLWRAAFAVQHCRPPGRATWHPPWRLWGRPRPR